MMQSSGELRIYYEGDGHKYDRHTTIKSREGVALFQNEFAASTMFSRLSLSPDGALFLVPSGTISSNP